MDNNTRLKYLVDYYEYLVTFDQSQSLLSIGVHIHHNVLGEDIITDGDLSNIEYDLETERDIISIENNITLLTFKQYLRDKTLTTLLDNGN